MKFIVDEMPESVEDCPLSEHKRKEGCYDCYVCRIPTYQPGAVLKVRRICKSVDNCNLLTTMKEV